MRKLNKAIVIALSALLCVTSGACVKTEDKVYSAKISTSAQGVKGFETEDESFLYIAGELRTEAYMNLDGKTSEDLHEYIKKAAELGVTVAKVSVNWKDIEPQKDEYDYSVIRELMQACYDNGVKMEMMWYSVLMCGTSHSYHLPEYIWNDKETYPRLTYVVDGIERDFYMNSTYYGEEFMLQLNNPTLMKRETKVINGIMDYVYQWEKARNFPKVLFGVQVYNEADAFPGHYTGSRANVLLNGREVSNDEAWEMLKEAMNNAGKAFKGGKYVPLTCTNLLRPQTSILGSDSGTVTSLSRSQEIVDLAGIDFVGYDPYLQDLAALKKSIYAYDSEVSGNVTRIDENGGEYTNTDSLILLAASMNVGYTVYEVISPAFFSDAHDQGILDKKTFEDKTILIGEVKDNYTARARTMIKGLRAAGSYAASTKRENFAAFNIVGNVPSDYWKKTVKTENVTMTFETNNAAIGYALQTDGYVMAFATQDATLQLSNGKYSDAESGSYNAKDEFSATGKVSLINGNTLEMKGGVFYRIRISEVGEKQKSDTDLYKSSYVYGK